MTETTKRDISDIGDEKTIVTGDSDLTLIGEASAATYDDAVGFRTAGKRVHRVFDQVPDDLRLLGSVKPSAETLHTIQTILSRPVKIDTLTYSSSLSPGQLLDSGYDVINYLRTYPMFALAREKLTGFYGFRAKAHLRVTLNPQPFEAGLFQIYFIPFRGFSQVLPPDYTNNEARLPFSTGCPNVMCNIALQSDVELAVPYTGPPPFVNITNRDVDFGSFYIQNLIAISDATNAASCELSVYMFFTDVELFGASAFTWPVTPEPARMTVQGKISNVTSKQDSQDQEPYMKTLGTFLRTTVSKGADTLLNWLGLSKPAQEQVIQRFVLNPFALQPTGDSVTGAIKMSLASHQNTKITQLGIDNEDEMDINYFIHKPIYIAQFAWSASMDAGTLLATYQVEPNAYLYTKQDPTDTSRWLIAPTRLRYIANAFTYWRGTNVFTFVVAATKFHSGRLRLVYSLGGQLPSGTDAVNSFPRVFSQVVDLRDGMVFVADCPYFGVAPWREVPQYFDFNAPAPLYVGDVINSDIALKEVPARIQIFVENELRTSSTVASEIRVAVFQSGGEDYQFGAPCAPVSLPMISGVTPAESTMRMQPQGLIGDVDIPRINMVADMGQEAPSHPEDLTFGETIQNIREMIKRFFLVGYVDLPATGSLALYPWSHRYPETADYYYDWWNYFLPCYRFFRGGMRYQFITERSDINLIFRFLPNANQLVSDSVSVEPTKYYVEQNRQALPNTSVQVFNVTCITHADVDTGAIKDLEFPISSVILANSRLQGGTEIEVPYYHRFHKSIVTADQPPLYKSDDAVPPGYVLISQVNVTGDTPIRLTIMRSAADDFNLGYLLGAPLTNNFYGAFVPS